MKSCIPAVMAMASGVIATLPAITIKGNAFYSGTDRFFIRGVDYQPGGSQDIADPLSDTKACKRDIANFKDLGLNTVRVYTVDNSANHDVCMAALDAAGIYLILDVNSPLYSLNRDDPAPSYNPTYLQNIFATMNIFSKYDNTLAFFSGNEVINATTSSTAAAPYIKAVTRDMKQYQGNMQLRTVPIGYSAADIDANRVTTAHYMNCGTDDARSDFFAFNDYSWCDPSTFKTSTWEPKQKNFSNYTIPLFLSEHGCNKGTRTFGDMASLYGSDMDGVYSGGLVYEYSQEASDFGLVTISSSGEVTKRPDYAALKKAYAANPNPKTDVATDPKLKMTDLGASPCPAKSNTWLPASDSLPALPEGAKKYMSKPGAGQGKGLKGAGSQNAGGASTETATAGSGKPTKTGSATNNSGAAGQSGSSSSGAASSVRVPAFSFGPAVCGVVVVLSSFVGAALL